MTSSSLPPRGAVLVGAVLIVGIFVTGTAPAVASEMPTAHAGHMPMDGPQMEGPSGPFLGWMPFVMPVIWVGFLAGVVYLMYRFVSGTASTDSAIDALDRAYARGKISVDEYKRRRRRLKS